jgi:hypothetical protein
MNKVLRVFIDTEFTSFINIDLISIGACADNGMEFYGENTDFIQSYSSDWVKSNIYPLLDHSKFGMKRKELSARLWSWIEELPCDGVIIAFDYHSDWDLMFDLFEGDKHPKIIGVENFVHNIFKHADKIVTDTGGTDQQYNNSVTQIRNSFDSHLENYFKDPDIRRHHALDDAIGNKLAYQYIQNQYGIY